MKKPLVIDKPTRQVITPAVEKPAMKFKIGDSVQYKNCSGVVWGVLNEASHLYKISFGDIGCYALLESELTSKQLQDKED